MNAPLGLLSVAALAVTRTVITTGFRMVYPFRTVIARGLGVELATVDQAITLRSLLGMTGPLIGAWIDVSGRRRAMLAGLIAFALSLILVILWPTALGLTAGLLLGGLAKIAFDAAAHATIGDRVPYQQRSRAIGIYELSWSAAFFLGMPAVGWWIARQDDWLAPLPILAAMTVLSLLLVTRTVGRDQAQRTQPNLRAGLIVVLQSRPALAMLLASASFCFAHEAISIVFGQWLEDRFELRQLNSAVLTLGASATVLGIAEMCGEGFVLTWTDRLGKRRAVMLGTLLCAAAALALPWLEGTYTTAIGGLFVYYCAFEIALVSSIALLSELTPSARATLLAGNLAAQAAGRVIGPHVARTSYAEWGILGPGVLAAVANGVALLLLIFWVREREAS